MRSALDSGIGRKELAEIHDLVQNRRPRLTDYGGGRAAEEGGALGSAGGDSPRSLIAGSEKSLNDVGEAGGSVETAVVALTKIVAELAKGKRGNSDKSGGLEAALDRAEGLASGSSDPSGGSSGSRSRAAAFRLLQNALKNEPEIIYTTIERLMSEDLLHSRQGTDLAATHASSRAWLEHRSHLGGYPTTVRLAWQMAGVFDALRADRVGEARARAALALASVDQQSMDGGSWVLADHFTLERPPPMSVFTQKRAVSSEAAETYHSRLYDPRWAELCLHRVRELDLHLESKKKLGKSRGAPAADPTLEPKGAGRPGKGDKGDKGPQRGRRNEVPYFSRAGPLGSD